MKDRGRSILTIAAAMLALIISTSSASTQDETSGIIIGKWVRLDGGYVIEIKSVDASGKLDASYYNPRPINVAKAEASRNGAQIKVYIELQDVNYPGSNYNLVYDSKSDQLKGDYYQAVSQEHYSIFFERIR